MTHRTFVDAEDLVLSWVKTTSVAPLVTVSGSVKIFLSMPKGAPLPVIVLTRVGGAPEESDTPRDLARISFDIYAAKRPQAKAITTALVNEIENLGDGTPYVGVSGVLKSGSVVLNLWLPEPVDDTPRYVVDAIFPIMSI